MMDISRLVEADKEVTLLLNSFHSSYFDSFFSIFTQTWSWVPLVIVLVAVMYRQWGARSLYVLLFIGLGILIADQVASSVIKPMVQRWRPSRDPLLAEVIHTVNGYRGGKYGFVSSHAANAFAVMTLTTMIFKEWRYGVTLGVWAVAMSYSRVYLGVHYVGDVVCGGALGVIVGVMLYGVWRVMSGYERFRLPKGKLEGRYGAAVCAAVVTSVCVIGLIAWW